MLQNICQNAFYLFLVLLHNGEMDPIFWCNWCRLCANEDSENSINIVCNNKTTCSTTRETKITLQEALEKYFWVQTSADNTMPNKLCTECFALVSSIINFNERVERVQQMYNFLLETPPISNPYDLKSVRSKFNVLDNDRKRWLPVQGSDSNLSDDIRQGTTSPMCGSKLGIHIKEEQTGTRILNNKYSEEQGECHRNSVDLEVMMCGGESDPNSEEEVGDPFDALTDNCEHADMEENCNNMDVLIKEDEVNRLESPFSNETPCLTPNSSEDKNNKRKKRKKLNGRDCRKKKHGEDTDFPLNVNCRECGESFYLYSTLLNHLKQCHGDNIENKQWKCPSCDRILQSWYNFARHMRIHMPVEERKTKKCSECESRFTSKAQLEAHINFKHKNDKPFICEECGCCLRTKSNLRQHALIHSSDAPFECEVCKKKFKNNSRLKVSRLYISAKLHIMGDIAKNCICQAP